MWLNALTTRDVGRWRCRSSAVVVDEVRERLGAARVADDDVVAVRDGEAGEL
jgi:hypothetical protein